MLYLVFDTKDPYLILSFTSPNMVISEQSIKGSLKTAGFYVLKYLSSCPFVLFVQILCYMHKLCRVIYKSNKGIPSLTDFSNVSHVCAVAGNIHEAHNNLLGSRFFHLCH